MHVRIPTAEGLFMEAEASPQELASYNKEMLGTANRPRAPNGPLNGTTKKLAPRDDECGEALTLKIV